MKEKILHTAADMFLSIGVKSVTMDEIAAELGISKKTIYTHFATKTKLIEATALYITNKISAGIETIQQERHNPIEELFSVKDLVLNYLNDEKSSPQHQLKKYFPKVFTIVRTKQQEMMDTCITENLKRGIAEGYYRERIPLLFTSRIYFIGMLGIKDRDLFPEEEFTGKPLTEIFLEYHLRAIVTEKGLKTLNTLINKQ